MLENTNKEQSQRLCSRLLCNSQRWCWYYSLTPKTGEVGNTAHFQRTTPLNTDVLFIKESIVVFSAPNFRKSTALFEGAQAALACLRFWYEQYAYDRGNRITRRKSCLRATITTTNFTCTGPGLEPSILCERPVTKRLAMARPKAEGSVAVMWSRTHKRGMESKQHAFLLGRFTSGESRTRMGWWAASAPEPVSTRWQRDRNPYQAESYNNYLKQILAPLPQIFMCPMPNSCSSVRHKSRKMLTLQQTSSYTSV